MLLAYLPILSNEFIGDDFDFITNWEALRSFSSTPDLLLGDLPEVHVGTYRPIRSVFYLLAYQAFRTNPIGYHLFSILVHISNSLLVYIIGCSLFKHKRTSLISALLFAVHPIHVEAITFVTATFDSVAFVFLLSAFALEIKAVSFNKLNTFKLKLVLVALACGTNEISYVYPLLVAGYYYFVKSQSLKNSFSKSKPYWGIVILFLGLRYFLADTSRRSMYLGNSFFLSQLVGLKAFWYYLYLFIFPVNLGLIHVLPGNISNYMYVDLLTDVVKKQSIFDLSVLLLTLLSVIYLVLIFTYRNRKPFFSYFLFWILITLMPTLSLFPNSVILTERYSYLASVGFCWLLGLGFAFLFKKAKSKAKAFLLLVSIFLLFAGLVLTWRYNSYWSDEIRYWKYNVSTAPDNFLAYHQLGQALQKRYRFDEAVDAYQRSLDLNPTHVNTLNNIGLLKSYLKQYPEAISYFTRAYIQSPENPKIKTNLSYLHTSYAKELMKQGEISLAKVEMEKALEILPENKEARELLSQIELSVD